MSKKVLVVEDSRTEALKAQLVLENSGYQVSLAGDGNECLNRAVEEKPDLIVLDTIMPRMSGYEAYHMLRINPITSGIPILMLLTNNGEHNKPKKMGSDVYLAKPYAPPLLLEALQEIDRPNGNGHNHWDNFMALMSHELRTPLHKIIGMTELALNTGLTEEQRGYLETCKRSADSMLTMVSDLLEFSELDSGDLKLEVKVFDLWKLVEEIAGLMHSQSQEKGLNLEFKIAPDVSKLWVGDPRRLRQVLQNLLGNAIKFTHEGKVEVLVTTDGSGPEFLHFLVSDTGIGIPQEKQQVIFEAFRQGEDAMTRSYGGIGLGLTLASQLVKKMNGRLWVESDGIPGKGSRFQFMVQLGRPADNSLESTLPQAGELRPLRILVAEDSPTNQLIARANLKKAGHFVHTVENGLKAVQAVNEETFDLVLMDVAMPEMDGIEATRTIREQEKANGKHVPIIAMTAFTMHGYREKCLEAGMDGYISKPVKAEELSQVVYPFIMQKNTDSREKDVQAAPPPVDFDQALDVVGRDVDLMEEVVHMFLDEYREQLDALSMAVETGDAKAVEKKAHRLRGAVNNIGGKDAAALAHQLETMGEEAKIAGADAVLKQFKEKLTEVVTFYSNPEWVKQAKEFETSA